MKQTRVVISQIQAMTHWKVLLTLVPNQQLGTASHVQILKRWPSTLAAKKFQKKVWASCSIAKGCLWLEAQLKQIGDSCQAVWESNYEVIKTEWELTLKEDHHSYEVNNIMDRTKQLL